MDITLDALLMTIIGGVGTLIGPIIGAGVIEFAQHYLSGLAKEYPIFERWIIFFGIIYIFSGYFLPKRHCWNGSIMHFGNRRNKTPKVDIDCSEWKGATKMNIGIVSTGVYIPDSRMTAEEIATAC